jgi:hypothetical protein
MLTHFPVGRTVIPSLRCLNTWKLEDYSAFRGRPFQVFVRTIKREHLHLASGDSCLGLLCVHIQLALIECLFTRENT